MCPPEEQLSESNQPSPPKNPGGGNRRRGRRGGRGRRRPLPTITDEQPQAEASADQVKPPEKKVSPAAHAPRVPRADGSAISQAVNEVMQVVGSLKQTLEQMEEVLELVELAERQKLADEREIESLLRALRQFQARADRPERAEY